MSAARLNDTLLGYLCDLLDGEPPQDAGGHPSVEVHERVGADWAAWCKQVSAVRVLLATHLVDCALAEYRMEHGR